MNQRSRTLWRALPILAAALYWQEAFSQSQKLQIVSCTSTPASVPGYPCENAFDGNPSTEWRVQAKPGSGQLIQLNFATLRRVKKITATWSVAPNESRNYITRDKNGGWRWVSTLTGSQTIDNVPLSWGEDLTSSGGNMIWHSQSVIIEAYSSVVAGLREISVFGPGIYTDNQILTATIPIPAWNISAQQSMSLPLGSSIPFSRIVGVSAFLIGDDNTVRNLTSLVPSYMPLGGYIYQGGGTNGGTPTHFPSGFQLFRSSNEIFLSAASFQNDPEFNDPAKTPRGYVTVRYLSQTPEF
jgi:hypothetical protein